MKNKIVISISITPALHKAIAEIAVMNDMKLSTWLCKILQEYVDNYKV